MGQKFMEWRAKNQYSGGISVPEIAHWTQDVINEVMDIKKENV